MTSNTGRALVVFGKEFPSLGRHEQAFDMLIADKIFRHHAEALGCPFIELDSLVNPGSVYEASDLLDELSQLKFANGTRITKAFLYKGYELWWIHYDSLFYYFCLPYTQYKDLLERLRGFRQVHFYRAPYTALFFHYLKAHGGEMRALRESGIPSPSFLSFGVFLQILITLLSLPILAVRKYRAMIFIGDKFEKDQDYDFRMKFIYEELRKRKTPFVEFIRSLESWSVVLRHAFVRRRPVVYSVGVAYIARYVAVLSGGRTRVGRELDRLLLDTQAHPEARFKLMAATHYVSAASADQWAIRIMQWVLHIAGVRVAFVPAANERNFPAVLGCKLNSIPTVGILHGVASRYSTPYDFMIGFDGEKRLSVDVYGVWSEWWKAYYIQNSRAYTPNQLFVSGPMRPLGVSKNVEVAVVPAHAPVRVLFIAEQGAVQTEVMPYLHELLGREDIQLTIKFRPYRDGFEQWLLQHEPDMLKQGNLKVVRGSMQDAIKDCDVAVGSYSTAVLEAFMQLKVPIFFYTRKWGDYYRMTESDATQHFFAESPQDLIEKIKDIPQVSVEVLESLRERYFGDPHQNGSRWVIDRMEHYL